MFDVFFVFDNDHDASRALQITATSHEVRSISETAVQRAGEHPLDSSTKERIDAGITAADCLVVLIGENTASDHGVIYAVSRAVHDLNTPVIGVRIDKLADADGRQGIAGEDPFTRSGISARSLMHIDTYDPQFTSSVFARSHIRFSMRDWVDVAVRESLRRNSARDRRTQRSTSFG